MSHSKLLPFALLALSYSALAQQTPTAGTQLQQIPPTPAPQKAVPIINVKPAAVPAAPVVDTATITVKRINVTGAQVFPQAELLASAGFAPGSALTLGDLRAMAARIAAHYQRHGYFVAQAYLPAQDIKQGIVTIAVIEGRYGKLVLQNQSTLSDSVANDILAGLNSGDLIASAPLESRLLRLSDLPGVSVKSTLVPGAAPGTSDLIVQLAPARLVSGSVDADNAGSRYTDKYRVGATVNLNNMAGHGDLASLRVITSGPDMGYARLSYQMPFGKATLGAAYSYLRYSLGHEFERLQANGTAQVASLYGAYPLIRSRSSNLSARLALDATTFRDKIDATSSVTDKKARALTASLLGDHHDRFGGGGVTEYSLGWTTGNLDIRTPAAYALDATTAQSNGHYNKLGFSLIRLQNLSATISLYGALSGQFASDNLDVSEKMVMGGMYGVRAYPVGETYADQGYLATVEARLLLPVFADPGRGRMHLIAFADSATATINKQPWEAGANRRTLSGAGIGLSWIVPGNFAVRTYYARKLGNAKATSAPDASGRFWIQAVKYF